MTLQKKANRMVAVNDKGLRIGETHPRAVLDDHEVDLLLELRAQGYSYRWLGLKFEVHYTHARRICLGLKRGQIADRFKRSPGR